MKVACKLKSYDDMDKSRDEALVVESHWNRTNMVVLRIGDEKVTVLADELRKAADNCPNR